MTRAEILKTIEEHHAQLVAMLDAIPEEVICKRPVVEWWTIKDVLGHIAMWEHVAIQFIAEYKRDGVPQPLGMDNDEAINAYNKRGATIRRDWSLARVRAEFDAAHRDLIAAIETLSDADLSQQLPAPWRQGDTLEMLIAVNSYQHNPEHIAQIGAAVKQ
ncbi:MAG: ClbS/DfsB family four-helix bundle protein [Chloroflexi bacterium]|nr:ClbS/DfsB family four-helix bundle protein [Chloroflexota bacterium]